MTPPENMRGGIRSGFADTAHGQIRYIEAGDGAPLVLLPHGGRSVRMYRPLLPLLAKTRRVIALDPPGSGESYTPTEPWDLPRLAEPLHEAALAVIGGPFALYGMNGGNKLGTALADAHPEAVTAFVMAGLTHSIVLSNQRRAETLGDHPSVQALLGPGERDGVPADWREQARAATSFSSDAPAGRALDDAVDRLQAILYRQRFYRAVTAYDMETPLRALRMPIAVLEFATRSEDESIGRQAAVVAAELGTAAHAVIELTTGAPLSLEDRPALLCKTILDLLAMIEN